MHVFTTSSSTIPVIFVARRVLYILVLTLPIGKTQNFNAHLCLFSSPLISTATIFQWSLNDLPVVSVIARGRKQMDDRGLNRERNLQDHCFKSATFMAAQQHLCLKFKEQQQHLCLILK